MSASSEIPDSKTELRARLVAERERLHPHQRLQLDRRICSHLLRYLDDRDGLNLAGFHAFRGEPDLMPALEALHLAGRRIHLPVVDGSHMEFRRWSPQQMLTRNRFGIPEPLDGQRCPIERLDVVFMPLVAFSPAGTRLGMGAGFYDRAFEYRLAQPALGPSLIGTAYSLQEVDSLPAQHWDVPIDGVITDRGLKQFTDD